MSAAFHAEAQPPRDALTAMTSDVSAAEWIIDRLHPFGTDLGSIIPAGFGAYARILHPWHPRTRNGPKVRWGRLASESGCELDGGTQFEELQAQAEPHGLREPEEGTLDRDVLEVLIELLTPATASPEKCWLAWWDGYGWMQGPPAVAELSPLAEAGEPAMRPSGSKSPSHSELLSLHVASAAALRVNIPGRPMILYRGPIQAASAFYDGLVSQSPNLWWPDDRSWCVASEIDFRSTYVGGSRELIEALTRDERLEAIPAKTTGRVTD